MKNGTIDTRRRGFLKGATAAFASLVSLAVGIPVIGALIGPAFRSIKPAWTRAGDIKTLAVGEPTKLTFAVRTTSAYLALTALHDVWVVRRSPAEFTVFSPICPHLGCEYNWNGQTRRFECPCHGSVYAIDGKVLGGPAPRPLDTLPARVEGGDLYVEWETFKIGIPEKVPA